MPRLSLTTVLCAFAAAIALSTTAAHARPIFMQYEGVDGSCTANGNQVETIVGGRRVVQWQTPAGVGELVFRPSAGNADRPMESLALNYTKVTFSTVPIGANVSVADDVWVDGRIITSAVWARWRKSDTGMLEVSVGKAPEAAGELELHFKIGGAAAWPVIDCGYLPLVCDHLAIGCAGLQSCSGWCEQFCSTPSVSRVEHPGAIAVDLPFGAPTTFVIPGQPPITADEISVVLRPARSASPMSLAAVRLSLTDLPGLQIDSARAEFGCPADFNASGELTVQDIFDFLAAYFAAAPFADFNASGDLTVQDIFDFLAAYFAGCA